jgi:hypothetical protein
MLLEELHTHSSKDSFPQNKTLGGALKNEFSLSQSAKVHFETAWEKEQKKLLKRI